MECKGKGKRMKEEAPSKKLPPKMYGDGGTPTKAAHDEILSSLLRINNFDSISSIKDESLDIDLSACVTISSASLVNGNSLSSTDFWRVLDESAQNNTELNLSTDVCRDDLTGSSSGSGSGLGTSTLLPASTSEHHSSSEFNVTFLRPEPPNAFTNSPFKKTSSGGISSIKLSPEQLQLQQQQHLLAQPTLQRKPKLPATTALRLKVFKEEPPEDKQLQMGQSSAHVVTKVEVGEAEFLPPSFTIFQQPKLALKSSAESDAASMPPPGIEAHEKSVEVDPAPLHKCLDCNGLLMETPEELAKHESAAHRLRLIYRCGECQREFEVLAGLKKHLKTHRTEGRKDTWKKCPDCGKW